MIKSALCKTVASAICLLCLLLCSCAKKEYSDTLDCSYLTSAVQSEILSEGDYLQYSPEDIAFIIDDTSLIDSYSVIYSTSGDDVGEVGIFHSSTIEDSQELFEDALDYLSDLKEEKTAFVKNYIPDEQKKLDNAQVKRFGKYVVFAVLDAPERDAVFKKIEELLK